MFVCFFAFRQGGVVAWPGIPTPFPVALVKINGVTFLSVLLTAIVCLRIKEKEPGIATRLFDTLYKRRIDSIDFYEGYATIGLRKAQKPPCRALFTHLHPSYPVV